MFGPPSRKACYKQLTKEYLALLPIPGGRAGLSIAQPNKYTKGIDGIRPGSSTLRRSTCSDLTTNPNYANISSTGTTITISITTSAMN
jgi:hypothetical protein